MQGMNRKSKMISVRISMAEYVSVKAMYEARGIRSVSALARDAMQRFLNESGHNTEPSLPFQGDCEARIRFLDAKLNTLQGEVPQLSRLLADTFKREP